MSIARDRGRLLRRVLGVVERPPAVRQQETNTADRIDTGDERFEGVEGGQILVLGGPVADPVEQRLASHQQVEAQQRGVVGNEIESLTEQSSGVGEAVNSGGLLAGGQIPPRGRLAVAALGMVVGDQAGVLVESVASSRPSARTTSPRTGDRSGGDDAASPRRRHRAAGRA